jgi:rare lipoprotein A
LSTTLPAACQPVAATRSPAKPQAVVVVGNASFYEEFAVTASGELYDPKAFTAAVQLALRDRFGGVRSGPNYRPVYVIAEFEGKRAVLKINNVGTMKPGRMFDLSRAAMEYFGGVETGLISNLKVTVLPLGHHYKLGPLNGAIAPVVQPQAVPAVASPAVDSASVETVVAAP